MNTQLADKTLDLENLVLDRGDHDEDSRQFCVMEAVAYVAGEPWTDQPACACPVIGAFMRRWNDDLSDQDRQMLKPLIPRLVGTRASREVEARRSWLVTDWMVRVYAPAWLELAGMKEQADALRQLPELTSDAVLGAAQSTIDKANSQASAARNAARDAARMAADSDARYAAMMVARSTARDAAEIAAKYAAWSAAWSAARDAAEIAAEKKLEPTRGALQASALALAERMIACK